MVQIGTFNRLRVIKESRFGVYLDGEGLGELLLPNRLVPENCSIDDQLDVFIYHDSDDRLIATTEKPRIELGQCAYLRVADVNRVGAFMDWGLPKDLLVPFNEQDKPMQAGYSYVVHLFLDQETERLTGSTRLRDFLSEETRQLKPEQAVQLLVCGRTDLGYKVVIDDTYLGLLFRGDAFKPVRIGEQLPGFIKQIRPDGRIDVALQRQGTDAREDLTQQILEELQRNGGQSPLTDKSSPAAISARYNVSKAAYKRALGRLLKADKVTLSPSAVKLR